MSVIEHEILKTMKRFAGTVTQSGNEKDGFTPLDHFELPTARYHYGTLCALLNTPEQYKPTTNPTFYQTKKYKRHEINTENYSWLSFQKGIEILLLNGHLEQEFPKGEWMDMEERVVKMTISGHLALNTDFYINQKIQTDYKKKLPLYTKATVFFTGVTAAAAIMAGIYAKKQFDKDTIINISPTPPAKTEVRIIPIDTLRIKTVIIESQKRQ